MRGGGIWQEGNLGYGGQFGRRLYLKIDPNG